jgi:hypothetical protein
MGAGEHLALIDIGKKRNRHAGLVWSQRIGKWCDPTTGLPAQERGGRVAKGVDYALFRND